MAYSSQGIVVKFGDTTLGQLTDPNVKDSIIPLDETDLDHTRENNQPGIINSSGTVTCIGDPEDIVGEVASLVYSGTRTKDYGAMLCTDATAASPVKGMRTTQYTFICSVAT